MARQVQAWILKTLLVHVCDSIHHIQLRPSLGKTEDVLLTSISVCQMNKILFCWSGGRLLEHFSG